MLGTVWQNLIQSLRDKREAAEGKMEMLYYTTPNSHSEIRWQLKILIWIN